MSSGGAAGGLGATFISSWGHVTIIYIALLIFLWRVIDLSVTAYPPEHCMSRESLHGIVSD